MKRLQARPAPAAASAWGGISATFDLDEQGQCQKLKQQSILFAYIAVVYEFLEKDQENRKQEELRRGSELGVCEQLVGRQAGSCQKSNLDQPYPRHIGNHNPRNVYDIQQWTFMIPPVDIWHLTVKYALGNVEETPRIYARDLYKRINRIEKKDTQKQRPSDDHRRVNSLGVPESKPRVPVSSKSYGNGSNRHVTSPRRFEMVKAWYVCPKAAPLGPSCPVLEDSLAAGRAGQGMIEMTAKEHHEDQTDGRK